MFLDAVLRTTNINLPNGCEENFMMQTIKVIDYIVKWLRDYADKAGLRGFTIGVSGGIDSAVTSCLCAETGKDVIVLNMPIYQAKEQISLASRHIDLLKRRYPNVTGINLDLTGIFDSIKNVFPSSIQDDLTLANTRSRLRMLTLYAFASHNKMLVAGTGNKVEDFGVGFYTKYGDGGVDLSPIADLMKSEVYALGKELGVLQEILNAPPTDGLWEDDRTDENQIGATYGELEKAMKFDGKKEDELHLSDREKEVLAIYRRFNKINKHKMEPIPVCMIPDKDHK